MKTSLVHSANIGIIAMIIIGLIDGVIGTFIASSEPRESLANLVYYFWIPIGLMAPLFPVLVATIARITWRQTGDLLINLNTKEAKKQVMISVWVSTAIATLPFLLLTLSLFVASVTTPGGGAGSGMAQFLSMLCMFWNLLIILAIGLIARLWIKNEKTNQPVA